MLETIENRITEQLKSSEILKGFLIESFPNDFKTYQMTSEKGAILIRYDGSSYSEPQTISNICQEETFLFSIITGFVYLENLKSSYPVLDEIKRLLTGLRINSGKLYPKKREYIGQMTRMHYYGYQFAIKLNSVGAPDVDNVLPFFKQED